MQDSTYSQVRMQDNRIDIDYISIIRNILKQWWVILLVAIGTYMFAYAYADNQYVPKYTTSETFIITQKGTNNYVYSNASSARDAAVKFSMILENNILQDRVAQELDMDSLNAEVKAEVITETNLIVLSVTADSPYDSFRILQSLLENHHEVSQHLLKDIIMDTIQAATIPERPDNYNDASGKARLAAVAGAAVMMMLFAALDMLRDTVKSSAELTKKLDAKSLGIITQERKHKTIGSFFSRKYFSMLISNPLLSFRYVECYQLLAARVRGKLKRGGHKVLLVTSVMENEGKSTVAANIALSIAESGDKVLLIDCDMRKPAQYKIFGVGRDEVVNLGEVLHTRKGAENLIIKVKRTKISGIFNAEYQKHSTELIGNGMLERILDHARGNFDYIIIDSSPMALVADSEALARYADASMLVVRHDFVLTKDINDTIDILNMQKAKFIGCVLNNVAQDWSRRDAGYAYEYSKKGRYYKVSGAEDK